MQLYKLLTDKEAASRMVWVIAAAAVIFILVAGVILAPVFLTFVLGVGGGGVGDGGGGGGGSTAVAPIVSFSFDYESAESTVGSESNLGTLTISHDRGDPITPSDFVVRGEGIVNAGEVDYTSGNPTPETVDEVRFNASTGSWESAGSTGDVLLSNQSGEMMQGQSIEVAATRSFSVDVVWNPEDVEDSSVLAADDGPDA